MIICIQRGYFGRLEDDGAASGEGGRDLGGNLVEGEVPRGDTADNSHSFAHNQGSADLFLPFDRLDYFRDAGKSGKRKPGLDPGRQFHRHAHFPGDKSGDFRYARLDAGGNLPDISHPFFQRGPRPGGEGLRSRFGRPVNIIGRAVGNASHHLFGGGVDNVDRPGAG